jgi:hypothetical protein
MLSTQSAARVGTVAKPAPVPGQARGGEEPRRQRALIGLNAPFDGGVRVACLVLSQRGGKAVSRSPRYRPLTVAALALALATPGAPIRGQIPFPVAPDPVSLLLPLVLTVLGVGALTSRSDAERARDLEARGEWSQLDGLIEARLARSPDDLEWRELRGRSLLRRGRCADALGDLRFAFERRQATADPAASAAAFDVGLQLGSCQMALWDLPAASATMTRLSEIAPGRWEPYYQLGVARDRLGDATGAQVALAALRDRNPPMADALAAHLARSAASRREAVARTTIGAASAPRGSAPTTSAPPRVGPAPSGPLLATLGLDGRLTVGARSLLLPAGPWQLTATTRQVVYAATPAFGGVIQKNDPVQLVTAYAYQGGAQGVATTVAFTANPVQAYGRSHWSADADCAAPGALHHDRFHSAIDQPECLLVRRVDAVTALAIPQLEPALRAAQEAGLALPAQAYLVHYRRHGLDWVVGATFLLPWDRVVGDVAAVQWGLALAAELRPLGELRGERMAHTPVLGPA